LSARQQISNPPKIPAKEGLDNHRSIVTLVQFPKIAHTVSILGHFAGPAFGPAPSGEVIAVAIIIHYALVGFFNGFLLAYLWLPGAFIRATSARLQPNADTPDRAPEDSATS
jgi:hypothetical protein